MSSQPARQLRRERRAAALAGKRAEPKRAVRQPRRIGIGLVSIGALGAGLVLVVALLALNGPKPVPVNVLKAAAPAGIPTAGLVLGNAAAPVTIDLYEDFQCPACLQWSNSVFPSLVRNELAAGSVKIAYHSYAFIGQESKDAARAAYAANQQDRFWDMWATLYANQGLHENGGSFSRARLDAMAAELGLDTQRFATDFDSTAAAAFVSDGAAAARAAGIESTPTLVVNGTKFAGSGYADLRTVLAAAAGH